MTYKGHVENGAVVLDEPVSLPDGTPVRIEPADDAESLETLHNGLLKLAGIIKDLPPDFARNHDHYIHGAPKEGCVLRRPHTKCQKESGPQPQPTLHDELGPILGKAKGLPADAARNHDHYLYGLPRK